MKKTYMAPSLVVQTIMIEKVILTASNPGAGLNMSGSVNANAIESRRGYSDWDDDED
ncbi:MAG: hypothetical protein K6G08_03135 [Prevotella sp.]|nr:hypothetical protein [Prevotella sp.]